MPLRSTMDDNLENDNFETEGEYEQWTEYVGVRLRTVASIWFSVAAIVPVGGFLYFFPVYLFDSPIAWGFIGLPIVSAALAGSTIGSVILDPWRIYSATYAALQGLKTAVAAYVIQMLTLSAIYFFALLGLPIENVLRGAGGVLFALAPYGVIFVGIPIILVGLLSGWMLFKISRSERFESFLFGSPMIDRRTYRRQLWRIMAVFLAISLPAAMGLRGQLQPQLLKDAKERQYLAMMQASKAGDTATLESLFKDGADANIRTDDEFHTPILMHAIHDRQANAVLVLLEHGADPNIPDAKLYYRTPLGVAAGMGDLDTVKALVAYGANIHKGGDEGKTPLMLAVLHGHVEVSKFLLDNGADIKETTAVVGFKDVVTLLLEQEERYALENIRRGPDVTPIKLHTEMVEFFRKRGEIPERKFVKANVNKVK